MAPSQTVTEVNVENHVFPPAVKAPGSDKKFFLAGAGERGIEIEGGRVIKVTAIGVYLEENAISALVGKWKGKSETELAESDEFYWDIITGPFEKFTQVTMILPLTGQQYTEKVTENCIAYWKAAGLYTDEEAKAIEKFREAFKDENFPPGRSIMFTQSPHGSLAIAFANHDSIPEAANVVIENKNLSETFLGSIIGKHGVSPAAKRSLAATISEMLINIEDANVGGVATEKLIKVSESFSAKVAPEGVML